MPENDTIKSGGRPLSREVPRSCRTPFPQQARISIIADERDPDAGNASHVYKVLVNVSKPGGDVDVIIEAADIHFTHGPLHESGSVVGCTNEALLSIIIDRLKCFQSGGIPSPHNDRALLHLESAMDALIRRQTERAARGVIGKYEE